ncbi:hypothetical protein [Streptomyces sp. H27-C3]|uniref:hypothetical protein n=1 Tax=Streptomyces sp. H27-C3 TaxID=3046305 RepID=UPI0024BAF6AD|nr:hypothetical protein [Streptomyces sp. H27-C3]MDJ0465990.1 hypothetical protein [Streptomyces sp. H27-C3]
MATKSASRRRRQPAANTKPRNGRAKAPATPASMPAQAAAPESTVPLVHLEADPVVADAADRAADLRDLAADDADRILADGRVLAAKLMEGARTEAASFTEAVNAEQARIIADAMKEADRVRTDAATTAATDADQVRAAAEAAAEQLLADARRQADTVAATAAGEADQVLADASAAVEQLLADARRQAQEVAATAAVQAEQVRTEAAKVLADAEAVRTELLAGAERTAAETRTRATTDAGHLLERVRGEAGQVRASADGQAVQVRAGAEKVAAELREDAARELEASRADAARVQALAKEDIGRLRAAAAEDAERLTRMAREEADRILAAARAKREAELKEAGQALAQARLREADADVTLKAADGMVAEAAARMKRATDRTERSLERKRLKLQAGEERRELKETRKAKSRAGKPTMAERAKRFVKVNAERLMVIGPITAPMAVAWTGQAGFAEDILGWVAPFTVLFAAAWELSTAFVAWMYHQSRQGGDAGTLYRVSTWIFALGAAVMNFWHASGVPTPGSRVWDAKAEIWTEQITYWHFTPKAVAFAAMSIVGMVLWELYASLIHRRKLREDGRVAKARPSIGAVRWVRYPVHSFTAWSLAITDAKLSTLDRAWTAAGTQLADRKAVRTGLTLHRVVIPRVRADDHGPAAIPAVLTLTRTDRHGPLESPAPVRPVQHGGYAVRSGPDDRNAVHGPVRTAGTMDRTGGPALALEPGPAGPQSADLPTGPGPDRPDRDQRAVPATRTATAARGVTVRTADVAPGPQEPNPSGPANEKALEDVAGPDQNEGGPDRTVITLTDLERTALDRLRTANEALNRNNIARAVRTEGGSIATDRAGQIAVALRQHTVR